MLAKITTRGSLKDARILIVEDEYLIADDLARALHTAGATVAGPVSTVEQADDLLSRGRVDAAILDINLRGDMAYTLAQRLAIARLPLLIVSGYGGNALPDFLMGVPRLEKPVSCDRVLDKLSELLENAQ